MQKQPHYTLIRRILFPYSGEEPLTRMQGLRVILTWGLSFSFSMTLCTMTIAMAGLFPWHRTVLLLLIAFLSGVAIFGMLGWVVVSMSNRAARIFQKRQAAKTSSTNGGRYGS